MSRATLLLDVDTTPARSALGDLRGSARSAQASLTAEARKGERERERVARDEARASQRAAAEAARARARLERESTRATERAERERTKATKDEASKRLKAERDEARDRKREIDKTTRDAEKAEKERTRNAEREANKRAKAEERATRQQLALATRRSRELGGRVATGVGTATRAVYGGAVAMHGMFQDARERRAMGERVLGNAVRNANPNASSQEQAAARDRVRGFVDETGINFGDVAEALQIGQGRGSALEARNGESSAQALDRALESIRDANAEGIDPGQYLAAQGRLSQAGLSGDALKGALRYTMRAAQRGSVEVDQIIQQGLPGAVSLMTQRSAQLSKRDGETDEAFAARRQQARLQAFQESVAVQEVGASTGRQAGNTANTLASLSNFMATPRRQQMIHQNILAAEQALNTSTPEGRAQAQRFRELRETMFEVDPTRTGGAMRMRENFSPLRFAAMLANATGGNAAAGANVLAGGGHGNPQALHANMRGLLTFIGNEGGRVSEMMAGGGVTDAQITEHRRDVESDALSNLTRNQELRDNALTDNTSWLKNLSDSIHDWQVRNPIANEAGSAAGGVVSAIGGGLALNAVKNVVARTVLPSIVSGAGMVGGAALAAKAAVAVAGFGAGALIGTGINRAIYSDRTSMGPDGRVTEAGGQAAYTNPFTADFWTGLRTSISQAVSDGITSAPVTAEIPMHVAIHARAAGTR